MKAQRFCQNFGCHGDYNPNDNALHFFCNEFTLVMPIFLFGLVGAEIKQTLDFGISFDGFVLSFT
jgi:hypothetical protein